jgi:hypothetical protein
MGCSILIFIPISRIPGRSAHDNCDTRTAEMATLIANLEGEKRKTRRSKTLLAPVLRSDEPALSPAIQPSEISGVCSLIWNAPA